MARMVDVIARLPHPLLSHLRVVTGHEHSLVAVDDWLELDRAVRSFPADVVIADPRADGTVRTLELEALLARYSTLPLVLYTTLTPETLKATARLAKHGVHQVVIRGFDDEPHRFRVVLDRLSAYDVSDGLLDGLAEPLTRVPLALARALERLFRMPHSFHEVNDLAEAAGMSRRTLDRWLQRAELAPARVMLIGARLARAYYYMRDPGYLLEEVTKKLGFSAGRLFARQVRSVTGLTPSALRRQRMGA
ncbi:MAG: helix-turn-helix domain-containing protein, partial [Gemmatimonadaceae bacterium]